MPSVSEILAGLTRVANAYWPVAVVWHVLVGAALVALARGWRPDRRVAAVALALPAASVGLVASTSGNPFNGITFAIVAALLAFVGARLEPGPAAPGPRWAVVAGALTIAFAWLYPHFIAPAWLSVIAAPIGLVPCPTLALILGFGLAAGGFASRAWTLTAALAGLFYAAFGIVRLDVWLDMGLLAATLATLVLAFAKTPEPRSRRWVDLHST